MYLRREGLRVHALELPMLLAAYYGGDITATDRLYPPLRDGGLTTLPTNTYPLRGDLVALAWGEQCGCVGRVIDVHENYVMLKEIWRPAHLKYPMATEARLDAIVRLVPRVPSFTSTQAADNWLRDTRELAVGDWVTWEIPVVGRRRLFELPAETERIPYEGKLIAIDDHAFDRLYWWTNRPRARGRFRVLRIDGDGDPQILEVREIMRP